MEILTDEKLIEKIRSEDQELFEIIVKRYEKKLLRYVNYITGNPISAADIVQETFIKAFVNLYGFNIEKKFSSWIYRIAHNESINHIKKYKKEILGSENIFHYLADKKPSLEENYEKEEIAKRLRENIKKLKIIYAEPLVLYFLEEKSYEEISDILRIPLGTVGTRINRGKKLLKSELT